MSQRDDFGDNRLKEYIKLSIRECIGSGTIRQVEKRLAQAGSDISRTALGKWLSGETIPTVGKWAEFCRVFGLDTHEAAHRFFGLPWPMGELVEREVIPAHLQHCAELWEGADERARKEAMWILENGQSRIPGRAAQKGRPA